MFVEVYQKKLKKKTDKYLIFSSQEANQDIFDMYEKLKDRITVEPVGEIPLKGKSQSVFVYAVTEVNGYQSTDKE